MDKTEPSTRLYFLWARQAPLGVIFRRGPSKQTQLLTWHLKNDQIEPGQWFKGRVWERRCDLSPDGRFLIYFAGKFKGPFITWTAISRVPYFSALALWPKGDGWGGGGLFEDNHSIQLNHRPGEMTLDANFSLPKAFSVTPFGERPGWGEDDPIFSTRLRREGWQLKSVGTYKRNSFGSNVWIEYTDPQVWEKKVEASGATLQMQLNGIKEKDGPWYLLSYTYHLGQQVFDIGRCDWADIRPSGYLYFAKAGCIYKQFGDSPPTRVIDLSKNRFEEVPPSQKALSWK